MKMIKLKKQIMVLAAAIGLATTAPGGAGGGFPRR